MVHSPSKRAAVLELLAEGTGAARAAQQVKVHVSSVKRWARQLRDGGGSGTRYKGRVWDAGKQLATSVAIGEYLEENPNCSVSTVRAHLRGLGLEWSWSSVRRLMKVQSHPVKKAKVQSLTPQNKTERLDWCHGMLLALRRGRGERRAIRGKTQDCSPLDPKAFFWSDETMVRLVHPVSSQNDRVWLPTGTDKKTASGAQKYKDLMKNPGKQHRGAGVMVSGLVSPVGFGSRLHVVPPGVKINADEWQGLVDTFIVPEIAAMELDTVPILILDNAPTHTARQSKELYKTLQDSGLLAVNFQPPASPDLSPLDWWAWSALKAKLPHSPNVRQLKVDLARAYTELARESAAIVAGLPAEFEKRVRACIAADGDNIEHMR